MAIKTIDTKYLSDIADAIREKSETTESLAVEEMAGKIAAIESEPVLQDKSITPSASTQTITADSGYDGLNSVTVAGDSNLVAENIAEGVDIFGVVGTHSGGSGGSVETCTVEIVYTSNAINALVYIDADTGSYKLLTDLNTNTTTINCVCNTSICLQTDKSISGYSTNNTTNLMVLANWFIFGLDAPANGVATIVLQTSSSGGSGGR